jgi:hypothetical protein
VSNVQSGTHCSVRPEWQTPFENAVERFLKKTGTAAGVINAFSGATGHADGELSHGPVVTLSVRRDEPDLTERER